MIILNVVPVEGRGLRRRPGHDDVWGGPSSELNNVVTPELLFMWVNILRFFGIKYILHAYWT